jgi:hypothetical protein
MKCWSYGINYYYKTASISLETAPWPIFAIEWAMDIICDSIPPIPLPNIKIRPKDNDGEWTTTKEWYGDLSQLVHAVIHVPIFNFCWSRIDVEYIEIDYYKLRELFYKEDKEFWDEAEMDIEIE